MLFYLFVPVITHHYTSLSFTHFSSLYLCPSVHNHSHMCSACRASRATRHLSSLSSFHPDFLRPLSRRLVRCHVQNTRIERVKKVSYMCDCEIPGGGADAESRWLEANHREKDMEGNKERKRDSVVLCCLVCAHSTLCLLILQCASALKGFHTTAAMIRAETPTLGFHHLYAVFSPIIFLKQYPTIPH